MTEAIAVELPSQDAVLMAVGRGIQSFSSVEMFLAQIYALLMRPAPFEVSLVSFDSARHLENKLRILISVARMRLDGEPLRRLEGLIQKVKARTSMRHKLAHWTTSYRHKNMPVTNLTDIKALEVRLVPPFLSALNLSFRPKDSIRLEQIEEFCRQCHDLSQMLIAFVIDLQEWIKAREADEDSSSAKISATSGSKT